MPSLDFFPFQRREAAAPLFFSAISSCVFFLRRFVTVAHLFSSLGFFSAFPGRLLFSGSKRKTPFWTFFRLSVRLFISHLHHSPPRCGPKRSSSHSFSFFLDRFAFRPRHLLSEVCFLRFVPRNINRVCIHSYPGFRSRTTFARPSLGG